MRDFFTVGEWEMVRTLALMFHTVGGIERTPDEVAELILDLINHGFYNPTRCCHELLARPHLAYTLLIQYETANQKNGHLEDV